ncbi:MAG: hypothetical protein IPH58_16500 [Sphingobacteriales bacterium]|jgi:transposase|nr:hypothetical protein [Sphingobacteriales bacterium]
MFKDGEFELEDFSQNADVALLYKHLSRKYPAADFRICYEAGFSGFSAQRWLNRKGYKLSGGQCSRRGYQ